MQESRNTDTRKDVMQESSHTDKKKGFVYIGDLG